MASTGIPGIVWEFLHSFLAELCNNYAFKVERILGWNLTGDHIDDGMRSCKSSFGWPYFIQK